MCERVEIFWWLRKPTVGQTDIQSLQTQKLRFCTVPWAIPIILHISRLLHAERRMDE